MMFMLVYRGRQEIGMPKPRVFGFWVSTFRVRFYVSQRNKVWLLNLNAQILPTECF